MGKWVALPICLLTLFVHAATAAPVTDGVFARFVGDWTISGTTRGRPIATGAEVRAAFGAAFIELHIKDPAGQSPYEARVFFGKDEHSKLVIHWLDATGGETSRTLGSGEVTGDNVTFSFPYPEGVFRDQLQYDCAHDRWRLLIKTGPEDRPEIFSDWYFDRAKTR